MSTHDELDEERSIDVVGCKRAVDDATAKDHMPWPACSHCSLCFQLAPAIGIDRLAGVALSPHGLAAIVDLMQAGSSC